MALFMLLIIPLPFTVRRKMFTYERPLPGSSMPCLKADAVKISFISENPVIAKLQYGLKITFIFILILFIDSVNRVYRVQIELVAATEGSGQNGYVQHSARVSSDSPGFTP